MGCLDDSWSQISPCWLVNFAFYFNYACSWFPARLREVKDLASSQMCLSEFQTYTGSLLKACLSQLVAPCRNLPAMFVSTNWLLGDDL